ncbi:MAG TPA: hypothetical protein VMZ50_05345 [Phycisphaerae bacterium]|nr:hypothetical protein [Phycisphaerae bacterium]
MPHVILTDEPGFYQRDPDAATTTPVTIPAAVSAVSPAVRPSFARYHKRAYVAGQFDDVLAWVPEESGLYAAGIDAPTTTPVIAANGSAVVTGTNIGYYTFIHKVGTVVVAESNPSPASNALYIDGSGRAWSSLQTSGDARVTHVRLYVSVGGFPPAFAADVAIGSATHNETVDTANLGALLPTRRNTVTGALEIDDNARGAPPSDSKIVTMYHESAWYAGITSNPDRLYPSKLFEPESVNISVTDGTFIATKDGEPITGLAVWNDELIIGCRGAIYSVQGYGAGDYRMRKLSSFYDVLSHASMQRCGPNGDLFFASQQGVCMYNGGFRFLMEDLEDYWRDAYRANVANYEDCFAAEDRLFGAYLLHIPQTDNTTFRYVGQYEPVQYGEQPWWSFDKRTRKDTCAGILADDGKFGEFYVGSSDGHIRKENVLTDADDDGDTYLKKMDFTIAHQWGGDQAGDESHASKFGDIDILAKHETVALTVSIYVGDDSARDAATPDFTDAIAAKAVSAPHALVAKTSEHRVFGPFSGKGASVRFESSSPLNVEVRGVVLHYTEGGAHQRPRS